MKEGNPFDCALVHGVELSDELLVVEAGEDIAPVHVFDRVRPRSDDDVDVEL